MANVAQNSRKTKDAWIKYLEGQEWHFWFTGTTGYELTIKSARRLVNRFFEGFKVNGALMFWVAEKFEVKDGHHIHALIRIPNKYGSMDPDNELLYREILNMWQSAAGNKAISNDEGKITWQSWHRVDLQKFDTKRGAGGYCAKYVFKGNADYDLLC